ncbi:MAG: trypsin-like peptidase domain-containing protein [Armatimonadota bacterium]|nr:trypsin-like peptidase domain-containing protein [bacterium]
MKKFIGYVAVFVLGFIVCAGVLRHWYGQPGTTGPVSAPILNRGGVGLIDGGSNKVRKAAGVVGNYVVNIDTIGKPVRESGGFPGMPDFFGIPFGPSQEVIPKGRASGVIYTSNGYILTNNHVVENATRLTVTMHSGKKYSAKLIGRDLKSDLAVIKIDANNLPFARFADSNSLQVGDWVIAVGNALGLGPTVTVGVVSAKRTVDIDGKKLEGVIQTDAAINQGNSGGALSDINGNLVGINTAILSTSPGGGNIGIGFAIPSNNARRIAEQLQKTGRVVRPYLGIRYTGLNNELRKSLTQRGVTKLPKKDGALIVEVYEGSPAAEAGLQPQDVILKINGKPVSPNEKPARGTVSIAEAVSKVKVGDRVTMEVWHASNGRIGTVGVRVAQMPADFGNQPQQ